MSAFSQNGANFRNCLTTNDPTDSEVACQWDPATSTESLQLIATLTTDGTVPPGSYPIEAEIATTIGNGEVQAQNLIVNAPETTPRRVRRLPPRPLPVKAEPPAVLRCRPRSPQVPNQRRLRLRRSLPPSLC